LALLILCTLHSLSHRPPSHPPPLPTRRSSDLRSKTDLVRKIAADRAAARCRIVRLADTGEQEKTSVVEGPGCEKDERRRLEDLRSEEHTSELQSREHLVCRLLLEKTNVMQTVH